MWQMHTATTPTARGVAYASGSRQVIGERDVLRFDWLMTGLIVWLSVGTLLDGWAHNTQDGLDTFYTPWHLVMYAGAIAVCSFTLSVFSWNVSRGATWRTALPAGYLPVLVGVGIFLASGVGDLIWHELFGIESNVEALLSPTHLGLAVGVFLIQSGPIRAAALRAGRSLDRWSRALPPLLSATLMLTTLTYMTQFVNPLGLTGAAIDYRDEHGRVTSSLDLGGMLLHSALVAGALLLVTRRWRWPLGSITLIVGLNAAMMIFVCYDTLAPHPLWLLLAAVAAGAGGELAYQMLRSAPEITQVRVLAVVTPVLFSLFYYLTLIVAGGGIWWSVHLWTGAIVLSGVAGLLVSVLVLPPSWLQPPLGEQAVPQTGD
jgi:hypothetical protein